MTEQPTGAPASGEGSSAATAASGTPPAATDAGNGQESEVQRLQRERDEAIAKLTNANALNASFKEKVEQANLVLKAHQSATPSTTAPTGDLLDQTIAAYEQFLREAQAQLSQFSNEDYAKYPDAQALRLGAMNAATALNGLHAQRHQRDRATFVRGLEPEIVATPKKWHDAVRKILLDGRAANVADALALAKGSDVPDDYNETLEKERAKAAEAEKAAEAARTRIGPGSPRPVTVFEKPPVSGQKLRITREQRDRIAELPSGHPDRVAYNDAYSTGNVEIITR